MNKILKIIEENLPLFHISKRIKQPYLDAYDNQFYKQIRLCNVAGSILYTFFDIYEIFGGVYGLYLAFNIIFIFIGVFIFGGVIYAHCTGKIQYNYWLCVIFVVRINVGLIQYTFHGSTIYSSAVYSLFWGYNSYTFCDVCLYLINNVSHKKKIVTPAILHFLSIGSLFYCIFSFIERPTNLQGWFIIGLYSGICFLGVIYKLGLQKLIQEQILFSIQTKQESKEYILDVLQEGIMIISQKNDFNKILSRNQSFTLVELQKFEFKIDFMNIYLKQILQNPIDQINIENLAENEEETNKILNQEILEEFIQEKSQHSTEKKEEFKVNRRDLMDQIEQHVSKINMGKKIKYSIKQLLQQDYKEIEKKVFFLIQNEDFLQDQKKERFVQIKIHKTQFEDHNEIALQIIDISLNIINKQIKIEIDMENQIRGWCCHELRNPLNSIVNSVELIESYFVEAQEEQEKEISLKKEEVKHHQLQRKNKINKNIKILKYSSKMLKFFVQDMLDFQLIKAEKVSKDISSFEIREAIKEVIQMLEFMHEQSGINLLFEYRHQDIERYPKFKIKTDLQRLQQILLNLYSNALKYTKRDGFIKIIVDIIDQSTNNETIKLIKITVWDNGLGISKSNQKKLFKLFGKVENDQNMNKKGIGLGLYICKMIANQFDGDITLESELNFGSIFTFTMKIFDEFQEISGSNSNRKQESQFLLNLEKNEETFIKNSKILFDNQKLKNQIQQEEKSEIRIQFNDIEIDRGKNEIHSENMEAFIRDISKISKEKFQLNQLNLIQKDQIISKSLEEPEVKMILNERIVQDFLVKQASFFNIQNVISEQNSFFQHEQNVSNKLQLYKKKDLLIQIQEFKSMPLINFDEDQLILMAKEKHGENKSQKPLLKNIAQFYKTIDLLAEKNQIEDEDGINKYFNEFQQQKQLILQKREYQMDQNDDGESSKTENQFQLDQNENSEMEYSFDDKNSKNNSGFFNIQEQVRLIDIEKQVKKNFIKRVQFQDDEENQEAQKKISQELPKNTLENFKIEQINKSLSLILKNEINKKRLKGPRIMIVDDVYFNIEIMKDVMQQVLKIDVENDLVEAFNGKEAVIKYIELHYQYQVCPIQIILMDCDMPVMNGFRAAEYILKFAKDQANALNQDQQIQIPVIVATTGDTSQKQQDLANNAGMKTMLSKPIDSTNLFKLLQNHGILK